MAEPPTEERQCLFCGAEHSPASDEYECGSYRNVKGLERSAECYESQIEAQDNKLGAMTRIIDAQKAEIEQLERASDGNYKAWQRYMYIANSQSELVGELKIKIEQQAERIEELEATVTMADGVNVLNADVDLEAWHPVEEHGGDIAIGDGTLRVDFVDSYKEEGVLHSRCRDYPINECYSTPEAAQAAAEKAKGE